MPGSTPRNQQGAPGVKHGAAVACQALLLHGRPLHRCQARLLGARARAPCVTPSAVCNLN
eukprot:13261948-Alexandrium_andersonii.AAC.1